MLPHVVIFIFILFCEVRSDDVSEGTWRYMNNSVINDVTKYCKDKNCLVKCCPKGEIMYKPPKRPYSCRKENVDDTKINEYIHGYVNSSAEMKTYFHFIRNDVLSSPVNHITRHTKKFELFKDGSMMSQMGNFSRLQYCVDFFIKNSTIVLGFRIAPPRPDPNDWTKHYFQITGCLISAFFMLLVFLVYALLPGLQNIVGLVLMSFLLSQSIAYIVRAAQMIVSSYTIHCETFSSAVYFFLMASFIWLSIMSFDLWYTIGCSRKCRDVHRQGERMKFMWYSLFAWGTSALITGVSLIIDKYKLYTCEKYKPPFATCFHDVQSVWIYLQIPVGIITAINILLYAMTVYNIWLIRRRIDNNDESRSTKNENRFIIYVKLFVVMGLTWILEQLPTKTLPWYIILNSPILFNGVFVFYVFVCKKSTILMLCIRFNIKNRYVNRLRPKDSYTATSTNLSSVRNSVRPSFESSEGLRFTQDTA